MRKQLILSPYDEAYSELAGAVLGIQPGAPPDNASQVLAAVCLPHPKDSDYVAARVADCVPVIAHWQCSPAATSMATAILEVDHEPSGTLGRILVIIDSDLSRAHHNVNAAARQLHISPLRSQVYRP